MNRFILILLMISMFLCSCTRTNDSDNLDLQSVEISTSEPVHIEMLVYANEGMFRNYENAITKFHLSQDNILIDLINFHGEDWSDYNLAIRSKILSGKAPDIIDVSVIYRDALIKDNLLLDLTPYVENSGINLDLYFKNQFEDLRVGNKLYGIPSGALIMSAYINKDLFKKADITIPSLDWNNTWNWEEFAFAANKIRELNSEEKEIYGMTMNFRIGWIFPFLNSNGSNFLAKEGSNDSIKQDESIETLEFLKELMFNDGVSPNMIKLITVNPFQHFLNGNTGIFVNGNWWMDTFRDKADFNWGVVPMPIGKKPATGMYIDAWAITNESDHANEAFEVLKFFLEEEQQSSGIMKGIPVLKSSANSIYLDRFPNLTKEEIDVWFDGIKYGITPSYFYGWSQFENQVTDILKEYSMDNRTIKEVVEEISNSYEDTVNDK